MLAKVALLVVLYGHLAAGEPTTATTLTATPARLTRSTQSITIRWSNLPSLSPLDYVAIYSPPTSSDLDYLGFFFLNASTSRRTGAGSLTLPRLRDLRAPYQFRLFRWPRGERSNNLRVDQDDDPLPDASHCAAVSGSISYEGAGARPVQLHLAFTDEVDQMRVLFLCGDAGRRSVRYGLAGRRKEEWEEVPAEARTYEQG